MSNNDDRKGRAKDVRGAFFPTPVSLSDMFPEMHRFSPRNLKYMRRFAEVWPDETIVQRCVAQLPWRHNICLKEKAKEPNCRLYYENGSNHYSVRQFCGLKNDQKNRPLDH